MNEYETEQNNGCFAAFAVAAGVALVVWAICLIDIRLDKIEAAIGITAKETK